MSPIQSAAQTPEKVWYFIYHLYAVETSVNSESQFLMRLNHVMHLDRNQAQKVQTISDEIWDEVENYFDQRNFGDLVQELEQIFGNQEEELPTLIKPSQIDGHLSFIGLCDQEGVPLSKATMYGLQPDIFLGIGLTKIEEDSGFLIYQVLLIPLTLSDQGFHHLHRFLSGFGGAKIHQYDGSLISLTINNQRLTYREQGYGDSIRQEQIAFSKEGYAFDHYAPPSRQGQGFVFPLDVLNRNISEKSIKSNAPQWEALQQILRKLYQTTMR